MNIYFHINIHRKIPAVSELSFVKSKAVKDAAAAQRCLDDYKKIAEDSVARADTAEKAQLKMQVFIFILIV